MSNANDNRHEKEIIDNARFVRRARPPSEPLLNLPPLVKALALINIIVFLAMRTFASDNSLYALAFVPSRYTHSFAPDLSTLFSPLTYMFLHGSWLHLIINLGMLMAFGAGLERHLGARRLLLLYILTGICAAFFHLIVYPHAETPMIGASGAISGLFGGVLMLMYGRGMMGEGYARLVPFVLVWIGISLFFGFFGFPGTSSPIAWTAHIGGFIAGLAFYGPVRRFRA